MAALIPGRIAATGQMLPAARAGVLHTVVLVGGSANATLTIYDNATTASGTVVAQLAALANDSRSINLDRVAFSNGLWGVLAGTGAAAIAYFE